jgi:hypothetical protein
MKLAAYLHLVPRLKMPGAKILHHGMVLSAAFYLCNIYSVLQPLIRVNKLSSRSKEMYFLNDSNQSLSAVIH